MNTFDPMRDIPQTDEQAEIAIRHGKDGARASAAVGIYQCSRQMGESVRDAYQDALKALLRSYKVTG